MVDEDVLVVAVFRREDLLRLHALLVCFDSPYRTDAEAEERLRDEASHALLRRYVTSLLQEQVTLLVS